MGMKVAKFGGSSLADAAQFKKVREILFSDADRRIVVPSAPGKRGATDIKVTDLFYQCNRLAASGSDFASAFDTIRARYHGIAQELGLTVDLDGYLDEVSRNIQLGAGADYAASRGEYLNGILVADYLGWDFVDPQQGIFFDEEGRLDSDKTQEKLSALLAALPNVKRKRRTSPMHMRTKKWAKPELAVCPYFTDEAETKRGHWREQFEQDGPLYLELGCGKGVSTAAMVKDNPQINYVVMDITCNVLGDTRRNIEKAFDGEPVKNVMIARYDISYIEKVFAPEDRVERIYINFCNPWTKRPKYAKRRLTHRDFLLRYRQVLRDGGEIHFKTDNVGLFAFSVTEFPFGGFTPTQVTHDLHKDGICGIMTDYEEKFHNQGTKINRCVAVKTELPPQPAAPEQPDGAEENDAPDQEA